MNIIFYSMKIIRPPNITSFFRNYNKKDKSMLGRWGSVKDPNKKTTYGYDCANEFSYRIITNNERE
jgi:hypothetical protein